MTSTSDSEIFTSAMGLPVSQLTPESRYHEYYVPNWHRVSDADIDQELDWVYKELLQQANPGEQYFYPDRIPTTFGSKSAIMMNGNNSTSAATSALGLLEEMQNSLKPSDSTDSTLSCHFNDVDNPDFHKSDEQENHVRVFGEALPESCTEIKQEVAPTAVMSLSNSADLQNLHHGIHSFPGSHALQRVASEPTNNCTTNWHSDDAESSRVSHFMHNTTSGMQPAHLHATWNRLRPQGQRSFEHRARAQTYNPGQTSDPHKNTAIPTPSNLNNAVARQHMLLISAETTKGLVDDSNGQHYSKYHFGNALGTCHHMLGFGRAEEIVNNPHVNINDFQHNNNDGPRSADYQDIQLKVQQGNILKSQSLHPSSNARNKAHAAKFHRRRCIGAQLYQDKMDEQKGTFKSPPPELHYNTIESARRAERPKFKTNPKKDVTIPMTDETRQNFVARMVRCMKATETAEDNAGMINQWGKLCQDEHRMEQAAWRLLDMALQVHVDGIPLLPNGPSCNRYASMNDRWNAICNGLKSQKSMCKHLLGSDFSAQLVNDPTTATQRVQNNRKVNAGKKFYLDKGRRAVHGRILESSRRDSSASTQLRAENSDNDAYTYGDGLLLGDMGDDNAEGDTDGEYLHPTGNVTFQPVTAAGPAAATTRRPKRQLDHNDPNEYGRCAKERRPLTKIHQKAAKRIMKNTRQPGDRSRFQLIRGAEHDLHDKRNENLVYSEGSALVQELFIKTHNPHGRQSSRDGRCVNGHASAANGYHAGSQAYSLIGSRQPPRQARPSNFTQDDTSTEGDDPFSNPRDGEGDDDYQDEGPQQD
ncbi:MAG: hypothetical protein Q9180_000791 [Flavoplaca navasiana]